VKPFTLACFSFRFRPRPNIAQLSVDVYFFCRRLTKGGVKITEGFEQDSENSGKRRMQVPAAGMLI